MKIAIITPYYKEDLSIIKRCHHSVLQQNILKRQDVSLTHFLIADGNAYIEINAWACQHIILPPSNNYGDTPRGIGAALASAQNFDALCFLDADNWFSADHLSNILSLYQTDHPQIITTSRNLYTLDEHFIGKCPEVDGQRFVDTNCYFIDKHAFHICGEWLFKSKKDSVMGDRLFWQYILKSNIVKLHIDTPSVNYSTHYAAHYQAFALPIPMTAKVYDAMSSTFISYAEFLTQH
ncbi:glycosyltransferase [Acinetobacter sp. B5B]|uniref:glycosyltransferase n=1 Tax=Acinetobacter baretiae TaxID=2605383 RepID=UPI0018C2561D|nr:glycosyltransferase [Acinetobacter baretiae]MBF7682545.1 glycosyltransferase [Acinetobacter baretiae]